MSRRSEDEFHDNDHEDEDHHGSMSLASPSMLEPMSVMTTNNYDELAARGLRRSQNIKATIASVLSVVFLIVGYVLTEQEYQSYQQQQLSFSHDDDHVVVDCEDMNETYFNDLLTRTQGSSNLCSSSDDLGIVRKHGCQCHNPFRPVHQDAVKNWNKIMANNIELLAQNYSNAQPDVVMYGDSITEQLVGRNLGFGNDRYQMIASVASTLLQKQEGGKINGLPMGIGGDQVSSFSTILSNTAHAERCCCCTKFLILVYSLYPSKLCCH